MSPSKPDLEATEATTAATRQRCAGTTKSGQPCRAWPLESDRFCALHSGRVDPAELGRRGGSTRRSAKKAARRRATAVEQLRKLAGSRDEKVALRAASHLARLEASQPAPAVELEPAAVTHELGFTLETLTEYVRERLIADLLAGREPELLERLRLLGTTPTAGGAGSRTPHVAADPYDRVGNGRESEQVRRYFEPSEYERFVEIASGRGSLQPGETIDHWPPWMLRAPDPSAFPEPPEPEPDPTQWPQFGAWPSTGSNNETEE